MKWRSLAVLSAVLLSLIIVPQVLGEGLTREQGEAILKELRLIRKELGEIKKRQLNAAPARPAPARRPATGKSTTLGNPILGDLKAPVTLVEFTDYQCPFCRRWYNDTFKKLKTEYIDTGKVRFVLRDLPLGFHANARPAARAAHCAGEQDKFWEMHNALFEGNGLKEENLHQYATQIGLSLDDFKACMASDRYQKDIGQDIADARKTSITGTPGFVLGPSTENEIQGPLLIGAQPYANFKIQIDRLLKEKEKEGQTGG